MKAEISINVSIEERERIKLEGALEARLQMCEELNECLRTNRGFFGFVRWMTFNALLRRWIARNGELLEKHRSYLR